MMLITIFGDSRRFHSVTNNRERLPDFVMPNSDRRVDNYYPAELSVTTGIQAVVLLDIRKTCVILISITNLMHNSFIL